MIIINIFRKLKVSLGQNFERKKFGSKISNLYKGLRIVLYYSFLMKVQGENKKKKILEDFQI